jgi:hypothetical protein
LDRLQGPGGAKQHYGVRPARPCRVSGRQPCLRLRPRNLSVPHGVSSKRQDRLPRGMTVLGRRDRRESRPGRLGATAKDRIVPVSAWLGVRAASAGDGCACVVCDLQGHRSAARGPIQSQWGRASDAAGQRDATGSRSHSLVAASVRSPWLPQFGRQLPAPGRRSHHELLRVVVNPLAPSLQGVFQRGSPGG